MKKKILAFLLTIAMLTTFFIPMTAFAYTFDSIDYFILEDAPRWVPGQGKSCIVYVGTKYMIQATSIAGVGKLGPVDSLNSNILEVIAASELIPIKPGSAEIQASYYDAKGNPTTKRIRFTVLQRAYTVNCDKELHLSGTGAEEWLDASLKPETSTDAISYVSSNPSVATVDYNTGWVEAVSNGECTIYVYAKATASTPDTDESNVIAKCVVHVDSCPRELSDFILDKNVVAVPNSGEGSAITVNAKTTDQCGDLFDADITVEKADSQYPNIVTSTKTDTGMVVLTIDAAGITPGQYLYNISAGEKITKALTIIVGKPVTVTFDVNGLGKAPEAITGIVSGTMITSPAVPISEGWIFDGWYKDTGLTQVWDFMKDVVTEDITLYAKWIQDDTYGTDHSGWMPSEKGNYYLANDVTLSSDWTVSDEMVLCLNDHVLNLNGHHIIVDGSLTLQDCGETIRKFSDNNGLWTLDQSNGTKSVTGGVITGGSATDGGAVFVNRYASFTMNGGNIVGNNSVDYGGGVRVNDGCFTMLDGTIAGNTSARGGGVYVSGTMNMSGGTIDGNTASKYGGGIYTGTATVSVTGGLISNNKATGNDGGGIGISQSADATLENCTITGNTAQRGGGVYNYGKLTINEGALIKNNSAATYGGGVYANKNSTLNMNGGEIIENNSSSYGGGVYVNEDSTLNMNGGKIIKNKGTSSGGGVYSKGMIEVGGTAVIKDNTLTKKENNLRIYSGELWVLEPTQGMEIGFNGEGTVAYNADRGYELFFFADDSTKGIAYSEGGILITVDAVAAIGSRGYASVANAIAVAKNGDTVKLLADNSESFVLPANVKFDTNGKNYTGTVSAPDGHTIIKNGNIYTVDRNGCTHNGTKQNGQAATCIADGWQDYYYCSGCDTYFEDKACTIPISDLDAWKTGSGKLAATGHNGDWVKVDDIQHQKICSDCGDVVKETHSFGDPVKKGNYSTVTCTVCNYAKTTMTVADQSAADELVSSLVDTAGQDSSDTMTLSFSDGQDTLSSVSIPETVISALSTVAADDQNNVESVTIELGGGTSVSYDAAALAAIAEAVEGNGSVSLELVPAQPENMNTEQQEAIREIKEALGENAKDVAIFSIELKVGGEAIEDFGGGGAVIAVPYEMPNGKSGVIVYRIENDGTKTPLDATFDNGILTWNTGSHSYYMATPVYTATLDAQGGTLVSTTVTATEDGKLINLPVPVKEGYNFVGWYKEFEYVNLWNESTDYVEDNNTTLFAKWTENSITPPAPYTPVTPTYTITGADTENGKLTVNPKNATAGRTVTITVTPDEGYKPDTLTAKDANGNVLTLTKVNDTTYTFKMPSSKVNVSATFVKVGTCQQDKTCPAAKFTDIDLTAWYHDGVHFCVENGYMQGVSADKFAPSGTLSRAMIVTMLWRMDGQKYPNYYMTFKDVPASEWYTEAIRWAAAEKIVSGYNADSFGPNDPVTREQLATILYNYAKYKGQGFTGSWMFLLDLVDRASISDWADEAVHWCSMKGVVTGKDGKVFDPQGKATRAEAATMLQRFCENILSK